MRNDKTFCPACNDTEVSDPAEVCAFCLASLPEDWVGHWRGYNRMVELAYANGQRPVAIRSEAQMVLGFLPSFH